MSSPRELTLLLRSQPRLLVTADLTEDAIAALETIGRVERIGWAAGRRFAHQDELLMAIARADVLIAGYEPITGEVMDAAPRLRLIASIRSDPRANVDLVAATKRSIPVLHTTGRTDRAVAEFTILLMLAMVRHLVPAVEWMRRRPPEFTAIEEFYRATVWAEGDESPQRRFTGIELANRWLGIVGFGSIGREVAGMAAGLGMRVAVSDPFVDKDVITRAGAVPVSLSELSGLADVVTLHARLGPGSHHLIDRAALRQMSSGTYLINTGRAGLIDRNALLESLDGGGLAGVALDVFDEEPPAGDDPLVGHPLVLPTPHLAAWTHELTTHHSASVLDELQWIVDGGAPRAVANPGVFDADSGAIAV